MGLSKALSSRFFSTFSLRREHAGRREGLPGHGSGQNKAGEAGEGLPRGSAVGRSPEGLVLGEDAGPAARLPGVAQPP